MGKSPIYKEVQDQVCQPGVDRDLRFIFCEDPIRWAQVLAEPIGEDLARRLIIRDRLYVYELWLLLTDREQQLCRLPSDHPWTVLYHMDSFHKCTYSECFLVTHGLIVALVLEAALRYAEKHAIVYPGSRALPRRSWEYSNPEALDDNDRTRVHPEVSAATIVQWAQTSYQVILDATGPDANQKIGDFRGRWCGVVFYRKTLYSAGHVFILPNSSGIPCHFLRDGGRSVEDPTRQTMV